MKTIYNNLLLIPYSETAWSFRSKSIKKVYDFYYLNTVTQILPINRIINDNESNVNQIIVLDYQAFRIRIKAILTHYNFIDSNV